MIERNADPRIPVTFGRPEQAGPDCALLVQEGVRHAGAAVAAEARFAPSAATSHAPGCACCVARGPAAAALGRLFLARARGEAGFFTRVVAVVRDAAGEAAVRDALARDPVAASRFRLG